MSPPTRARGSPPLSVRAPPETGLQWRGPKSHAWRRHACRCWWQRHCWLRRWARGGRAGWACRRARWCTRTVSLGAPGGGPTWTPCECNAGRGDLGRGNKAAMAGKGSAWVPAAMRWVAVHVRRHTSDPPFPGSATPQTRPRQDTWRTSVECLPAAPPPAPSHVALPRASRRRQGPRRGPVCPAASRAFSRCLLHPAGPAPCSYGARVDKQSLPAAPACGVSAMDRGNNATRSPPPSSPPPASSALPRTWTRRALPRRSPCSAAPCCRSPSAARTRRAWRRCNRPAARQTKGRRCSAAGAAHRRGGNHLGPTLPPALPGIPRTAVPAALRPGPACPRKS